MLNRIHLENFKASKDIDVRLSALTLLAGINSSGKSTLLQAVALLRQSDSFGLRLSGDLLQLGLCRDVLNQDASGDAIAITITEDDVEYRWVSRGQPDFDELPFTESPSTKARFLESDHFQFLQANRIVPQTLYPQATHQARATGFLGPRGEYTVAFLSAAHVSIAGKEKVKVPKQRMAPRTAIEAESTLLEKVSPTDSLVDQVAGWLQHISPGVRLAAPSVKGTDEVMLQFSYTGRLRESGSDDYRPTNVGFGLTYCLPIVVACLSAPQGALLLLENPEAHLHPRGQAALGDLIAKCASDGVQIVVETHSDHLLNGVRLAVKRRVIESSDVVLHFFQRSVETGEAFVQSPVVFENGRLSNWPNGFFDQWDNDVDALLE